MIPCKTDPDLHFDDNRAPEAARMCRACPAREACLALALDMESGQGPTGRYGVWGGLTPAERAAFCRQKTAAPQMGRRCAFAEISELRINVLVELGAVQMILVGVAEALDGEAVVLGDLPVL